MKVYHHTKNIREGFMKFHESIKSIGAIVCFDFEDSISADDPCINIVQTRNQHRDQILDQLMGYNRCSEFGFRINSFSSGNYKEDINALDFYGGAHTILIPKVESGRELMSTFNEISFSVNEIIPIIETRRGFDNAREILSINDFRFKRIAFGHCDYNLSLGNFPFFHHDTTRYWEWIAALNEIGKEYDKEVVNSPVLELENEKLIHYSMNMCRKFSQVTGHISLCKMHTEVLCSNTFSINPSETGSVLHSQSPEMVLSAFEKFKVENKSFAITSDRRIVSPQERAMAIIKNNQ